MLSLTTPKIACLIFFSSIFQRHQILLCCNLFCRHKDNKIEFSKKSTNCFELPLSLNWQGYHFSFPEHYTFSLLEVYLGALAFQENCCILVKIFKNRPRKVCGRQPLKNLKWYGLLCLPQILVGPFLNILTNMCLPFSLDVL